MNEETVFYGLAALIVWRYPINEERHLRLGAALQRRGARSTAISPR